MSGIESLLDHFAGDHRHIVAFFAAIAFTLGEGLHEAHRIVDAIDKHALDNSGGAKSFFHSIFQSFEMGNGGSTIGGGPAGEGGDHFPTETTRASATTTAAFVSHCFGHFLERCDGTGTVDTSPGISEEAELVVATATHRSAAAIFLESKEGVLGIFRSEFFEEKSEHLLSQEGIVGF